MSATIFDPIRPGDIDTRAFDFIERIGASGVITDAVWSIAVSPASLVLDDAAASRIIGTPAHDDHTTSCQLGTMLGGAIYTVSARVTIDDGRSLSDDADLECLPGQPDAVPAGTAAFSFARWVAKYPEFSSVDPDVARGFWNMAGFYWRNDGGGPVGDIATQAAILDVVTAHLAALSGFGSGDAGGAAPSGLVGRISSVSQGPVSISTDIGTQSASAAWWWQTPYGAQFWQMTMPYRQGRWIPAPPLYPCVRPGFGRRWY